MMTGQGGKPITKIWTLKAFDCHAKMVIVDFKTERQCYKFAEKHGLEIFSVTKEVKQ